MTNAHKIAVGSIVVLCIVALVFFIATRGGSDDEQSTPDSQRLAAEPDRADTPDTAMQPPRPAAPRRPQRQPEPEPLDQPVAQNDIDDFTFRVGEDEDGVDEQALRQQQLERERQREAEREAEEALRREIRAAQQREAEQRRAAERERLIEQRQQQVEAEYERDTQRILAALRGEDVRTESIALTPAAQRDGDGERTRARQPIAASQPRSIPETYTVEAGDTLGAIAQRFYGAARHYVAIAQHNDIDDPRRLRQGQRLRLPAYEEVVGGNTAPAQRPANTGRAPSTTTTAAAAGQPPAGSRTYTVQPNDRLWTIAERHYDGRGVNWRLIYEANRDQLDSPDALRPGMELIIPPQPEDSR